MFLNADYLLSWQHYLCLSSCVPSFQSARVPPATAVEPLGLQGVPNMELCRHCLGLLGGLVCQKRLVSAGLLETSGFNSSLKP